MIKHELSTADILQEMVKEMIDQQALVDRVGGGSTDQERAEATAALHAAMTSPESKLRTVCVGCDQELPFLEALACQCGSFVCPACADLEDDGVCNHEKPAFIPDDDDDSN